MREAGTISRPLFSPNTMGSQAPALRLNVDARGAQAQTEFGPVRLRSGQRKVTTVRARQFPRDAQPEAVPRRLFVTSCAIEPLENMWCAFR